MSRVVWIAEKELNKMLSSARVITHNCPHCNHKWTYPCSNGDVFVIAMSGIELECPQCHKSYIMSWEGEYSEKKNNLEFPF